ncbi:hypothetical protein Hanom_Chr04g00326051 [Helianthus anomalus]
MASILHFYGFHISQMSLPGMVRVRHFKFLCRSHGIEPSVENFRAFYQLIRNIGFYSFGNRDEVLLHQRRSYSDRDDLCESDTIEKEELPIPKGADWYLKLTATPNRIFGENVLVVAQMSDKWPETTNEVPILKFEDREAHLYQAAFPTFGGSMGVRPLQSGEPYWYEQIKGYFLYPLLEYFPILQPQLKESVGSSQEELSSRSNIFAGVLRDLGIDPEDRPKKAIKKKIKYVTVDTGATSKKGGNSCAATASQDKGILRFRQSNLGDYVVGSDSLEGLSRIGEKKKKTSGSGSKSSGSAGSRIPEAGVTPSSIALDEEEEEEEHEEEAAAKLVSWKRSREEVAGGAVPAQKAGGGPVIGKQSRLHTLYKFSPG